MGGCAVLFGGNSTISEQQKRLGERESGRGACVWRQRASVRSRWQSACVCFVLDCMCLCPFSLTWLCVTCVRCMIVWKVTCQGGQCGQHHAVVPTLPPGVEDAHGCHCRYGYCRKRGADMVCLVNSCVIVELSQQQRCSSATETGAIVTRTTFKSKGPVVAITSQLFQSIL